MQPYSTQRWSEHGKDRCQCTPLKNGRPHTMKGLGEGRIPGVVISPANMTGRQYDWRRPSDDDEFAMSDNSSFALGGLSLGKIGMLGGLGAFYSPEQKATILGVWNGTLHGELLSAQRRQQNTNADIAAAGLAADKLEDGQRRAQAQQLYRRAAEANQESNKNLADAIKNYNEVAAAVTKYSAGLVKPKMMAGMGALGVPLLVIAAIVAAAGFALNALGNAMANWNGNSAAARGYLDQLASVIEQGGGVIKQTVNLGLVAALLGAGFLAYRVLQAKGHAR